MRAYRFDHLSDGDLLRTLNTRIAQERTATAEVVALIAEVDARRLYLPAGYPSMYAYCVQELGLSEDAAYKRIQAARTARQFPALFTALAEGRLHLSAVVLLAPHLTPENADELIGAAGRKTKAAIDLLLAQRFPRPDVLTRVQALPAAPPPNEQLAPRQVEALPGVGAHTGQQSARNVAAPLPGADAHTQQLAPGQVEGPFPRVKPLSPERFALQLTVGQSTHDKLRYAQALLSHQIPSGDIAAVLERALDALIGQLEKKKFAATDRPRTGPRRRAAGKRSIPAQVKRAVWKRDKGQCTFVGPTGQRCPARSLLEFDHIDPVARGGQATVERMRLRCRAHNQYEAECTFGDGFMHERREQARYAAQRVREGSAATSPERAP